jgi:hypothetical protein
LDVRTLYHKAPSFGCTVLEPEIFRNLSGGIERSEINLWPTKMLRNLSNGCFEEAAAQRRIIWSKAVFDGSCLTYMSSG